LPQSDPTLSQEGSFADAKATGDALNELNDTIHNDIETAINELSKELSELTPEDIGAVNVANVVINLTTVEEGYVLDARQAYELNRLIQKRATTASYTATFPSSGWSTSAPYTQTAYVDGILLTDDPIVDIDMSSATNADNWGLLTEAWSLVGRVTANAGSVTAYCYEEKPTIDIKLILKVVR
jgi:hypothetical protein